MKVINLQVKLYVDDSCEADDIVESMTYEFEHEAIQLTEIAEVLSVKELDYNL